MKKIFIGLIILGTIMVCINLLFGDNTITYIDKTTDPITGIIYYRINIWDYLDNITTNITNVEVLELQIPTRPWVNITSSILEGQFWADLGNNLAVILDYVILVVNVLLYPIRIGGYFVKNILAIIGINTYTEDNTNGLYWLILFVRTCAENLWIPYV